MFCFPSGNVESPIGRGPQLSQSTTSVRLPILAGLAAVVNVLAGDRSAAQPDSFRCCRLETCVFAHVCSRASHGFSHCGYLPAFSNGFTSRRAVFDALTWPLGWESNVPLRCISELRSLGDWDCHPRGLRPGDCRRCELQAMQISEAVSGSKTCFLACSLADPACSASSEGACSCSAFKELR